MSRQLRLDPLDGWHHVMNRGVDRRSIFFHDSDRLEFGRLLGDIHERFGVRIHAYCLLDNHYHLVVHCPNGELSAAMQRHGSIYTRHVNDRVGRDGPIFRGRFRSRLITSTDYLANAVRYVHRNALDVQGVTAPDEYRWSSHRTYLGHRRRPEWLVTDHVLRWFGNDIQAFDAFVRVDDSDVADRLPDLSVADMLQAVDLIVGQRIDDMRSAKAVRRAVALTLGEHLAPAAASALHTQLGLNRSSVKTARWRANRLAATAETAELITATRRLLTPPVSRGFQ